MAQRQLKDWGVIAANASASISVRVWSHDQTVLGIFTVNIPQAATMISQCTWSGAGWLDTYLGAEVLSVTNGDVFAAPVDNIANLTTVSGEKLVTSFGLGVVGAIPGQSTAQAFPAAASATWGGITGSLSSQTDLQAALDGKAATVHTHAISAVTGLQAALDAKQASLDGTASLVIETRTSDPGSPATGRIWLRTDL